MQFGVRALELPRDCIDALIPATAHATIDAAGRLARCSRESADAGGLAHGAALAKVPADTRRALSARISHPVVEHLRPGLSHAQATEAWAQRPQPSPQAPARRLRLRPGESLGVDVDPGAGRAHIGPVVDQAFETQSTVMLLRPITAARVGAPSQLVTVPVADTLDLDLTVLGSLLHVPAVLAVLRHCRLAARETERVRQGLRDLRPLLRALAVAAVSGHPPAPPRG